MNFSLEIGLKTDLNTLPNIKDIYITLLRGDQYKDVANKAKELVDDFDKFEPYFWLVVPAASNIHDLLKATTANAA